MSRWLMSLGFLAGGCLSVPDGPTQMCQANSDCGFDEVCETGVCWGNPPAGPFAAVLSPPSSRRDLVPREISPLVIPTDGQIGQMTLASSTLMGGVVTGSCPQPPCETLGASITVTRKPQFTGGPGFKTVVNVDSKLGFSIPVLPVSLTDDPYVLTVVPDAGHQVPPLRLTTASGNASLQLALGGPDLPVISGTLTDTTGQGLAGYRVAALGHWDAHEPLTEVSSVMVTDATGAYAVTLSAGLTGPVELVATAPSPSPEAPAPPVGATIRISNIPGGKSSTRSAIAAGTLGSELGLAVDVLGVDDTGAVANVVGASVTIAGTTGTTTSFTVSDTEVTGQAGTVQFRVLKGSDLSKAYTLSIVPPPNSALGAVFEQPLTLPAAGDPPLTVRLNHRLAIQGTVIDASGQPVVGASITARPALRFLWALEPAAQTFLGSIPPATKATDSAGGFTVQVDAILDGTWGSYDLVIEPPTGSDAPTFVRPVDIVRNAAIDTMPLGVIPLPPPARVHGTIVAPDGEPIPAAEIKLFYVQTQLDLCTELLHAPAVCTIPATLLGRGTSDDAGLFRVALPRVMTPQP
ncbi:MAG TPA: hypothetical protein VGC42_06690 [Kofleriaceae bacterium]